MAIRVVGAGDFTRTSPRIVTGSFIDRSPGQSVPFPAPRVSAAQARKSEVPIPRLDAILANPPYVRSQHQDDLDPSYRGRLFSSAAQAGVNAPAKTDLFAFFIYHSISFLAPRGRIGFVTSSSWLTADYDGPTAPSHTKRSRTPRRRR